MEPLSARIRRLRRECQAAHPDEDWTQTGLAKRADLPRQGDISKYERGKTIPELPALMKLARVFGQPLLVFLAGTQFDPDRKLISEKMPSGVALTPQESYTAQQPPVLAASPGSVRDSTQRIGGGGASARVSVESLTRTAEEVSAKLYSAAADIQVFRERANEELKQLTDRVSELAGQLTALQAASPRTPRSGEHSSGHVRGGRAAPRSARA